MATDDSRDALERFLTPRWKTSFLQTVRLIEYQIRSERAALGLPTDTPGSGIDPDLEPIQFKSNVHLRFSSTDLRNVELNPTDGDPPALTVDFMGLAGSRGALPLHITELVRERIRRGDHGLKDFLDLLSHRLVSLLWRIRQKHRPTLHTDALNTHDFARYLMAFTGLLSPDAQAAFNLNPDNYDPEGDDHLVDAWDMVLFSGLLWQHDRSMQGLERLIAHLFGFPVRGQQCEGDWIALEPEARTALSTREHHNRLGQTSIAGRRVWDGQAGFGLKIGPVDWDTYIALLPIGQRYDSLRKVITYYTRGAFDFTIHLTLDPAQSLRTIPTPCLPIWWRFVAERWPVIQQIVFQMPAASAWPWPATCAIKAALP